MMKPGYRQMRGDHPHPSQRGALEPPDPDPMPEATLTDLSTQADQIEARIQHLKTGINNIRQLQSLAAAPPADLAEAQDELNQLQQTVEEFEATLASHLLNWSQLQEPFWQAVRYGGLGLVGGWILHWLVRG